MTEDFPPDVYIERIYRVVGLVEFDENDGTSFLWSNISGVEVGLRDVTGLTPQSQSSSNSNSNQQQNLSGDLLGGGDNNSQTAAASSASSNSNLNTNTNTNNSNNNVNPDHLLPRYAVVDVKRMSLPTIPSDIESSVKKVAQWFLQFDVSADQQQQQNSPTNKSPEISSCSSYPITPATSTTAANLVPHHHQQQGLSYPSSPNTMNTGVPQQHTASPHPVPSHSHSNCCCDPVGGEQHWMHFSDIIAYAGADAVRKPQGSSHYARAVGSRFEVPDCFARGFTRLMTMMSVTLVKVGNAEFGQDLLAAACHPKCMLDIYDSIGEYVDLSRKAFEIRYASFLPRTIEIVDAHLERVISLKKQMLLEREKEEKEAQKAKKSENETDNNDNNDDDDNDGEEEDEEDKTISISTISLNIPGLPSQNKLEDIKGMFQVAPEAKFPCDTFKIENEIQDRTSSSSSAQNISTTSTTTTNNNSNNNNTTASNQQQQPQQDILLQWCLKRGAKGNLYQFEKVVSLFSSSTSSSASSSSSSVCAGDEDPKRSKENIMHHLSFDSDLVCVQLLKNLRTQLDDDYSDLVNNNNNNNSTSGGNSNTSGVSACLCTSAGKQDEFLVDPSLSADPSAWPGLLWNATDYLKVLRRQETIASDNNSVCIPATHFFA